MHLISTVNKIYMKNILLILSITFLSISVNCQNINKEGNGYSKIVNSKLKKNKINSKIKEWLVINYKNPKEVISFQSDDKIIIKGLFPFEYKMYSSSLNRVRKLKCYISNTIIFSIKDYKFKIDLTSNNIETDDRYIMVERWFYQELISEFTLSKDKYIQYKIKVRKRKYPKDPPISIKTYEQYYLTYTANKRNFENIINNLFSSIKKKVNENDDW
tara:strand:- start:229 stop:876 length:648 start_codon:yes stop_codon:yes gene_type:complete